MLKDLRADASVLEARGVTKTYRAGLAGLFVVTGSVQGDGRLVVAGFRAREVLGARLGIVAFATVLTTAASLAVTALGFQPRNWTVFALGTVLTALTYAMLGVLVGPRRAAWVAST